MYNKKCGLFLFLSLLCLLICCFNVVSAADISVSDVPDDFNYDEQIINKDIRGNVSSISSAVSGGDNFNNVSNQIKNIIKKQTDIVNDSRFVRCVVSCEDDFKNVSKQIKNLTNYSGVIVNITKDININNDGLTILSFNCENKTMFILGNHFKISVKNPDPSNQRSGFLYCRNSSSVIMSDVTVSGFNTAINNYGNVALDNVTFLSNCKEWPDAKDYGGAIYSKGTVFCVNCSFIKNTASYGGAIYSEGSDSKLTLLNCYFEGNDGYNGDWSFGNTLNKIGNVIHFPSEQQVFEGSGDDVMVGKNGIAYAFSVYPYSKFHGPGAFIPTQSSKIKFCTDRSDAHVVLRDSFNPVVKVFDINDSKSYAKTIKSIRDSGTKVDMFIINFNTDIIISKYNDYYMRSAIRGKTDDKDSFIPCYGSVIIKGNGHTFSAENFTNLDEFHFATINERSSLFVDNLTIKGTNCAIMNYGTVFVNNVTFLDNHVEYVVASGDDAGAIRNVGFLVCNNCTFVNNYGLWATIYGEYGAYNYLNNCTFIDNKHSKSDGAELYSYCDANFFIDGLKVNGTDLNSSVGLKSVGDMYLINGTNITINYGTTSKLKKCLFELLGFGTQVLAMTVGFGFGIMGCPVVGIIVGGVLGSALKITGDIYYASSTHTSYDLVNIPMDILFHTLSAWSGAEFSAELHASSTAKNANRNTKKEVDKDTKSKPNNNKELEKELDKGTESKPNNIKELEKELEKGLDKVNEELKNKLNVDLDEIKKDFNELIDEIVQDMVLPILQDMIIPEDTMELEKELEKELDKVNEEFDKVQMNKVTQLKGDIKGLIEKISQYRIIPMDTTELEKQCINKIDKVNEEFDKVQMNKVTQLKEDIKKRLGFLRTISNFNKRRTSFVP